MAHVQVALRMRPCREDTSEYAQIVPPGTLLLTKPGTTDDMYQFSFSHAFSEVTNGEIYEAIGRPVVEAVLEGYNGTVLAYGQTGSGAPAPALAARGAGSGGEGAAAGCAGAGRE